MVKLAQFRRIPTYMITIHQRRRTDCAVENEGSHVIGEFVDGRGVQFWNCNVTDRQTDGQTTCDRNTALCTKVHRAVKTTHRLCRTNRYNQCSLNELGVSVSEQTPRTDVPLQSALQPPQSATSTYTKNKNLGKNLPGKNHPSKKITPCAGKHSIGSIYGRVPDGFSPTRRFQELAGRRFPGSFFLDEMFPRKTFPGWSFSRTRRLLKIRFLNGNGCSPAVNYC